ncbi:MAG TPA: hypothetical protein PLL95_18440 [Anaerolineales bacterium]|nr:hypothetical protein [Anaerolineales bacterium]
MKSYVGKLEAYYEQGWEGMIVFSFMPDGCNGLSDLIALQDGQHLSIYETDDSILWSGKIKFVKRGFFDKHKLTADIWSDSKQKGVSYADWMDWFWRKPPLKATLEIEE